jgi:hypothetical protein
MLDIPATLKIEHENLHADLAAAIKMPRQTGQAAKQVAVVLHEHFVSEEEFAMRLSGCSARSQRAALLLK